MKVFTNVSHQYLVVIDADGSIEHWHMTSGKRLYKIQEENNQIYAVSLIVLLTFKHSSYNVFT